VKTNAACDEYEEIDFFSKLQIAKSFQILCCVSSVIILMSVNSTMITTNTKSVKMNEEAP
jgi:hypothetical protein